MGARPTAWTECLAPTAARPANCGVATAMVQLTSSMLIKDVIGRLGSTVGGPARTGASLAALCVWCAACGPQLSPPFSSGDDSIAESGSSLGSTGAVGSGSGEFVGTNGSGATTGASSSGTIGTSGEGDDAAGEADAATLSTTDSSTAASGNQAAEAGPPPSTGLSVLYEVEDPATTSSYMGSEIEIKNAGTASPAVSALKVRYYFTDNVHMTLQMTINWSHIMTTGADADATVTATFVPLSPPATDADTYIEFAFSSGHGALAPGESFVFSWQAQGPNPAQDQYTQTDDYSFDATKTTLASWEHVVLLENGSVAWGEAP
jgi:hypothetical protein